MLSKTRPWSGLVLLISALACSNSSDGPPTPTSPPPPTMTQANTANFRIVSDGQRERFNLDSNANTVFCDTNAGWASLWVRMSVDGSGNGGNGAHIDVDVCNPEGGGTYSPKDPARASCGMAMEFDLWWHGDDGAVFNNERNGMCMLDITESEGRLLGMFECLDVTEDGGGSETVDVVNGSFDCAVSS